MAADPADDLPTPPRVPAIALATLDADRLAPAEMAATLRFAAAAGIPPPTPREALARGC